MFCVFSLAYAYYHHAYYSMFYFFIAMKLPGVPKVGINFREFRPFSPLLSNRVAILTPVHPSRGLNVLVTTHWKANSRERNRHSQSA
jgi:hypothetical protein